MSEFEMIANEPQPGDVVVLTTGKVRYTVTEFHLTVGSRSRSFLDVQREETFREEPYTRAERVQIGLAAWNDLVRLGASTVERPTAVASGSGMSAGGSGTLLFEGRGFESP